MFVAKTGTSWHFRHSFDEKQQPRISFGMFPKISPAKARELRAQAQLLLAGGINPKVQQSDQAVEDDTFKAAAET
ncbi:Arm DNA-binding domain-containing protein [Paraburkholderia fungorum]|nr:Arm DNA-binding domain-containing protein [Paraburkholderia fungorum]